LIFAEKTFYFPQQQQKQLNDEAEKERLQAKPTCFLIVGKPGVGKSTLAKKMAESWKCVLVDDFQLLSILSEGKSITDDVVLQLILARLNSPDVKHYGYVLSCLPFLSDDHQNIHKQLELIQNLKLPPDFVINIKCPDSDLVQRLSGLKKHPETGQSYSRDQWEREEVYGREEENHVKELESEEEQPHNKVNNQSNYRCSDYMEGHNPMYLLELDGNSTPEEQLQVTNEDILTSLSSSRTVAPGFWWRWSRWGQTCPVALKEGKNLTGSAEFSVGFQDKLYLLSSREAHQKFLTNPRQYLLPPMPRTPCRVSIIGAPLTGKSTLCRLVAQHYGGVVLDVEELLQPVFAMAEQERFEKIKVETTRAAIKKIKESNEEMLGELQHFLYINPQLFWNLAFLPVQRTRDQDESEKEVSDNEDWAGWVLDNFPRKLSDVEVLEKSQILPDFIFCLRDTAEKREQRHDRQASEKEKTIVRINVAIIFSPYVAISVFKLFMQHVFAFQIFGIDCKRSWRSIQICQRLLKRMKVL
uniref:Uncharacterized protein n=1 Tax=Oryzias latipes TaxID=8090 RepID=H2MFT6_ORYLA